MRRILDDWWSRPLPALEDGAGDDQLIGVSARPRAGEGQGPGPIDDEDFRRVVERLNEWAESATAFGDEGPIGVVFPSGRRVRIVMSAADLSDMLTVMGTIDGALFGLMSSLRKLPDDTPYLVHGNNYSLASQPLRTTR